MLSRISTKSARILLLLECLDHSMHTFHAYSGASIGLLASLCGPWVLISMAPTHIDHHASYHSPLHPLRAVTLAILGVGLDCIAGKVSPRRAKKKLGVLNRYHRIRLFFFPLGL